MKRELKLNIMVSAIVILAVAIDQALKLYVRTHFALGESHEITSWFYLCYIENDGMAFGIEWFSKLLLTLFRIAAVAILAWYTHRLIYNPTAEGGLSAQRSNSPKDGLAARSAVATRTSYLVMVALVIAGALGNIIDCVFYGKLFGYAGWFYGKVVDMFYFPLITNSAGECIFFRPVFNFADSCITVAVICIIIWFRKDLDTSLRKPKQTELSEKQ